MGDRDQSHLTAINRRSLSAPAEWLLDRGLIQRPCLDYGCGHGFDAYFLGIDAYDPFWRPSLPNGLYRTILMTYVLNVIPSPCRRRQVVARALGLLEGGGDLFVSVRRDRRNLKGRTRLGTWQGWIDLEYPVLVSNSRFAIYHLRRES